MPERTSALPLPPDELISRVVSRFSNEQAEGHRALFLQTERRSLEDLEHALTAVGDTLSAHEPILEFGCGCGRTMPWMEELGDTRTLIGTDIDARAIEWASNNLPFARFDINEGLPPTRMPPLVHIALRQQAERIEWLENDLRELHRTLRDDR